MVEFTLLTRERVVYLPVPAQSILFGANLIGRDPVDQVIEIVILFLFRAELFRLPRPCATIRNADIDTRVEKDELFTVP